MLFLCRLARQARRLCPQIYPRKTPRCICGWDRGGQGARDVLLRVRDLKASRTKMCERALTAKRLQAYLSNSSGQ